MSRVTHISEELRELIDETEKKLKNRGVNVSKIQATQVLARIIKKTIINTKPTIHIHLRKRGRNRNSLNDLEI